MKYFSTFTGIGGFELGINKAYEELHNLRPNELADSERPEELHNTTNKLQQWECVGYSEINKYAIQIYQSKFPEHKNYGDITKIIASELPDFDLFVGGFPCQAFSIAGKRGGFKDTRGTLFFDCARILKEKQPRNFILENVKGLLSHDNGRTFKTIINTLTELGYCVEWQVLNAKNFGVPQNRERVFIVGHLGGIPKRKVFPITGTDRKIDETSRVQSVSNPRELSRTLLARDYKDPKVIIQQLNNPTHSNDRVYGTDGISLTLNTMQGGNRQPKVMRQPLKFLERNQKNIEGDYSFTVDTANTGGVKIDSKIRRLTPLECERLMGYPDGWTEGLSDTQRYKTLGNGIVSNVVAEVVKRLYSEPVDKLK